MPTLVGARRRGFTPEGFRLFAERIGVSKSDSWIDMSVLEDCMREDLNARAERRIAVLDPVRLVIDNYPEGAIEDCYAPNHPQQPELGRRALPFSRELWIERDDFMEHAPKGYFRLAPGAEVRLRYAYIVRCVGVRQGRRGQRHDGPLHVRPRARAAAPRAPMRARSRATSTGCPSAHARPAEVRLYDRLFAVPVSRRAPAVGRAGRGRGRRSGRGTPEAGHAVAVAGDDDEAPEVAERNYLDDLNPDSKRVITAYVEPRSLAAAAGECVPVRAPRLLRRRPQGSRRGRARCSTAR